MVDDFLIPVHLCSFIYLAKMTHGNTELISFMIYLVLLTSQDNHILSSVKTKTCLVVSKIERKNKRRAVLWFCFHFSVDLMCWTDIEQFRRIIYRDRKQREAKSIYIKDKYLNKKYFFGPQSPASLNQQDQVSTCKHISLLKYENQWFISFCQQPKIHCFCLLLLWFIC